MGQKHKLSNPPKKPSEHKTQVKRAEKFQETNKQMEWILKG